MEENKNGENDKLNKIKKGIGAGILAGAIGLTNFTGLDEAQYNDNTSPDTKIETSVQNSILGNNGIQLEFSENVSRPKKIPPKDFFEKRISRMNVDESIKPVLVDILMRRSAEFDFSKKDIKRDIERLTNNIEEIIVDNNNQDWTGVHSPYEKTIRVGTSYKDNYLETINKAMIRERMDQDYLNILKEKAKTDKDYLRMYEEASQKMNSRISTTQMLEEYHSNIYETLTHEVYHGLSYEPETWESDLDGNDRVKYYSLHEMIVEKAADRTVKNAFRGVKDFSFPFENTRETQGYAYTTFITDVVEATYGITEKEFLGSALKGGIKNLKVTLTNNANENPRSTEEYMDDILKPFNKLFYSYYGEGYINNKNDKDKRIDNIKTSMAEIYGVSIKKMNNMIQVKKINNLEDAKEYIQNLNYNYSKLNYVIDRSLKMQSVYWQETIDVDSKAFTELIPDKAELMNRIHNMNEIIKHGNEFETKEQMLEFFNQAKENRISFEQLKEISKNKQKEDDKTIVNLYSETNNLDIKDIKYWEQQDLSYNKFFTPYDYRNKEAIEKYTKIDGRENKWDNREINEKMKSSYTKLYEEHKKEGTFKRLQRTVRERYNIGKSNIYESTEGIRKFFRNVKNRIFWKKEPLLLDSGENSGNTKSNEEERKEFMDKIKVDVNNLNIASEERQEKDKSDNVEIGER